jgi:hypothetical protein
MNVSNPGIIKTLFSVKDITMNKTLLTFLGVLLLLSLNSGCSTCSRTTPETPDHETPDHELSEFNFKSVPPISYDQVEVNGTNLSLFSSTISLPAGIQDLHVTTKFNDKKCRLDPKGVVSSCLKGYTCKIKIETLASELYEIQVRNSTMYIFSQKEMGRPLAKTECIGR